MAEFNKTKYNPDIDEFFEMMEADMIALPLMIELIHDEIVRKYHIAKVNHKVLFDHIKRRVITKHMDFDIYDGEENINWNDIPGMKKRIWTKIVDCYNEELTYEETLTEVGQMVLSYPAASKYAIWLGMYIGDATIDVYDGDIDVGLTDKLYSMFDENEVLYRGYVQRSRQFELSTIPEGTIDEEGNIIDAFNPDSVDIFVHMYDDITVDSLPEEAQKEMFKHYNIPPVLEKSFAAAYRGNAIFTRDILKVAILDPNMNEKGFLYITNVLMGETVVSLVLKQEGEFEFEETDIEIASNMGSILFHPEFNDDYERALTNYIFNNENNIEES
jgi:hypothetical protein